MGREPGKQQNLFSFWADVLAVNCWMICCMSHKLQRLLCSQRVSIGKWCYHVVDKTGSDIATLTEGRCGI